MTHGDETALVLGASGLVGLQVARKLVSTAQIPHLVLVARTAREVREAEAELRAEFPTLRLTAYHGDIFLPGNPVPGAQDDNPQPRRRDPALRRRLFAETYEDFEGAYRDSLLAKLLLAERPEVVVDCVNTATGISYQDVFTSCLAVQSDFEATAPAMPALRENVETLMVSISVPQLILHCRILNRALTECGARLYLKIGTTGTGGMGLNIPYTHGEERPSAQLLNKTAVAFAHTGMLFLMARTPGTPIIKELKPAALIGYRGVEFREARGRVYHRVERSGNVVYEMSESDEPLTLYHPRAERLAGRLDLTPDSTGYETLPGPDGSACLRVPLVDTGENGLFTRGEFAAITALDQMEYITPEEIADIAIMEVQGVGTGRDVVQAIDSSVLSSTYKAGLLRPAALEMLARLEKEQGIPSIALGRLGPPGLAKYLFEAHLFRENYGSLERVLTLENGAEPSPERLSRELFAVVEQKPLLAGLITSIGIPILCPDGKTLLRGPVISSPPYRAFRTSVEITPEALEGYVRRWVDLRPARMGWWLDTFRHMRESTEAGRRAGWSTARVSRAAYLSSEIEIGDVVAWIFSNLDEGFRRH